MPLPRTTNDRWTTAQIVLKGGIISNVDELSQARTNAGALTTAINFECGLRGGYRRVSGYLPFESTAVPGTAEVLGVGVFPSGVIAARNDGLYYSPGSGGWNLISSGRSVPPKVRFSRFNFGFEKLIIVDGVNQPSTYDGTTWVSLADAPIASTAIAFANYMFLGSNNILTFSAPEDETDYDGADGAGQINVGFEITGLRSWRETLYIFGRDRISALTGTVFGGGTPDAVLKPITLDLGCIATDTIQEISGDIVYLSADGIRTISGTTRIGDLELAAITDPIHDDFQAFYSQYEANNLSACVVRAKNQYRLFAANTGTQEASSIGWLACIRGTTASYTGATDNWEFFQLQGINASCADSGYINAVEYVVHGSFDGWVYRQEQGNNFNGSAITAILKLVYNGFDDPELRKTFYKVKTNVIVEGPTIFNGQLSFDFGDTATNQPSPFVLDAENTVFSFYGISTYGASTYGGTPNKNVISPAIGSGLNMALIYTSDDGNSYPYTIRSIVLDYQINGRR